LVEDTPLTLRVLRTHFERLACIVSEASDGEAGLSLAITREFDIVISDWDMPIMDGLEFTRRLRAHALGCPYVVILSAHDDDDHAEEARDAGAAEFITKPIHREDVERLVSTRAASSA
jgi:CheY-like chemotaxis protein